MPASYRHTRRGILVGAILVIGIIGGTDTLTTDGTTMVGGTHIGVTSLHITIIITTLTMAVADITTIGSQT